MKKPTPIKEFLFSKNTMQLYKDGLVDGFFTTFMFEGEHVTHFMHYHDYYEISFCLGNDPYTFYWKDQPYTLRRGDVVFCNIFDGHMHDVTDREGHERISAAISPDLLLHLSTSDCNLLRLFDASSPYCPVCHTDPIVFSSYLNLLQNLRDPSVRYGKKALQKGLLEQLLALLYNNTYTDLPEQAKRYSQARLSSELINYVDTHLSEPISLKILSDQFHYSSSHLCRVFKEFTGDTLSSYIVNKRIAYAAFLLNGSLSVADVAKEAGFTNYSYFYKTFIRQYGQNPSEYRQARRRKKLQDPTVPS